MDEQKEEEYLQDETEEKIETNLADIIGDRHKGTLQVLIVGEDGKITNSEYIFKKEMVEKKNFKEEPEEFFEDDTVDDENLSLEKKNDNEMKVKDFERCLNNSSDICNASLKNGRQNLDKLTLNKFKQLNFKYKKLKKQKMFFKMSNDGRVTAFLSFLPGFPYSVSIVFRKCLRISDKEIMHLPCPKAHARTHARARTHTHTLTNSHETL